MAFEAEQIEEHQPEAPVSVRDSLSAAIESAGGLNAETTDTPPAAPADKSAAPAAPAAARSPDGKFAKAPEQAQAPLEPNAALTGEKPPSAETILPPSSWSATAKADFAKLPAHIQAEVVKREADIEAGKAQWDQKGARLNRLDAILGPRAEKFRLRGLSEEQAVGAIFAAQDMLERDPVNALQYLAKQAGVDLRQLFANAPPQQQQAQLPPVVQQMANEINILKQKLSASDAQAQQAAMSETEGQIQAFAADPANTYFANVRNDMGALIRAGQATGLKDAYEKACWANPEIRTLLLRDQQSAAAAENEAKARQRAEAARRASGSITGSPTPGSSPASAGPAPSIAEELRRAFGSTV